MKRNLTSLLLAGLLLLSLTACGGEKPQRAEDMLRIVATTYPLYLFTTAVTEDVEGVEVSQLVNQQSSCLHDYTLTVNDMKAIEAADVIVMNGAGLEDFMADALAQSDAAVVDCSEGVGLLPAQGHEGHDHETEYDPHIWMRRDNASLMMQTIAFALGDIDPANDQTYLDNFAAAGTQMLNDISPSLELGRERPGFITFHDGFQYFAQAYELDLLKSIEEEEGSEASAADIKEIVSLIRARSISAIFTERNGPTSTAEAISRETGCKIYSLDMIMSGDGTGIQPYIDAMNENLTAVLEALG